ncbi:MAG TPA: sporulation protein YtfJ [Firmicutes bacterium]|nr:sporulation protein YtfJ [Bacillota bacterium]
MGENHPIEGLMETAMESLKAMVDVNTILGDPVETPDGNIIVPVSRVSFGFAAGGTEFESKNDDKSDGELPFGGGSGGGISLNPVAFLVVGNNQVRLLPVDNGAIYDRLLDMVPKVIEQIRGGGPNPGQNISPQSMYEI